jgi:hypothetical protein
MVHGPTLAPPENRATHCHALGGVQMQCHATLLERAHEDRAHAAVMREQDALGVAYELEPDCGRRREAAQAVLHSQQHLDARGAGADHGETARRLPANGPIANFVPARNEPVDRTHG